jgi:hypothetical protein
VAVSHSPPTLQTRSKHTRIEQWEPAVESNFSVNKLRGDGSVESVSGFWQLGVSV